MKKNMGTSDKVIRVLLALLIAGFYFSGVIAGTLGIVLLMLAGIFLVSSFMSFCPLYRLFGLSTCPTK